jgi:aminopeptidase N
VANGQLTSHTDNGDLTTWVWDARTQMASYLATLRIGDFTTTSYTKNGIRFFDAVDASLSPTIADNAQAALNREPEFLAYLASVWGRYPYADAGGTVDDVPHGFALESSTRPIYDASFFEPPRGENDWVVVHELAHQWVGDRVALLNWRDIWLNEGFATYASWLWSEHEGGATAQQRFEGYGSTPEDSSSDADDGFWDRKVADPGADTLFDPVYDRGALTLHALRLKVGDETFFNIMRTWTTSNIGRNVTTAGFIALAERLSGQDLDQFFQEWLYTEGRPASLDEQLTFEARSKSSEADPDKFGAPTLPR